MKLLFSILIFPTTPHAYGKRTQVETLESLSNDFYSDNLAFVYLCIVKGLE